MSFVAGFAPDAKSQWRALDVELQELVLDELDRLAANPPTTPRTVILSDLVQNKAGIRDYVFLRCTIDRAAEQISVIGIVQHSRPLSS